MQPLCIGVADFTCTEVRAAGARAKYVLANRRVVKRDSGNIISGACKVNASVAHFARHLQVIRAPF